MTYLLALDQGTSSSRSIVFDPQGQVVALAQQELPQIYPQPGWVEHDPMEIWRTQLATAREALSKAKLKAGDIRALGITNQRETTLLWNRKTGKPVHHAIVWQDRRAEPTCAQLREQGLAPMIQSKTGLIIDAYFSGTKLKWLLDHVPQAREQAQRGELAFGTVDSWLLWQLTEGALHATDVTNASRTMLFDVRKNEWDAELLKLLDIPIELMPKVLPSSAAYGETRPSLLGAAIAIGGVAGDQQSALFGQACFKEGMAKNTYGTGCFMLMHTGAQFQTSVNGLVTTSAAQLSAQEQPGAGPPQAGLGPLGGSDPRSGGAWGSNSPPKAACSWVAPSCNGCATGCAPSRAAAKCNRCAMSVPDSGGVMMVPAFTGLGAPYWKPDARGMITGLTRGTTVAHIARAALESIAFQSSALLQAMSRDAVAAGAAPVTELRVDGGACVNDLLMQFQADLLGIPVVRPAVTETTALGAAYLAGLSSGVYQSTEELSALWKAERRFLPTLGSDRAADLMAQWEHAVRQATLA